MTSTSRQFRRNVILAFALVYLFWDHSSGNPHCRGADTSSADDRATLSGCRSLAVAMVLVPRAQGGGPTAGTVPPCHHRPVAVERQQLRFVLGGAVGAYGDGGAADRFHSHAFSDSRNLGASRGASPFRDAPPPDWLWERWASWCCCGRSCATPATLGAECFGGKLAILGGSLAWALGSVLSKRWKLEVDPFTAAGYEMTIAGACNFLAGSLSGGA